jgi:zinc protease
LERTNYFETVPSNHLEVVLWLEANRMGNLLPAMTQQKLDTQREVVKNERRWSIDNQPYGTWWEKLPALCFPPKHPFHHSLMGSMEDLDAASLDDVSKFFQTYYAPDNAVLTITGDFDSAQARQLITRYFGDIPTGKPRPAIADATMGRVFGSAKREVVKDNVVLPRLFLAFLSPVFGTDEYYVASVVSAVLGFKKGSRLYRTLVRDRQTAADAHAFTYNLTLGGDLLVVDATARPGVSGEKLEAEVMREIDTLMKDGVASTEVARAKTLIETEFVSDMQSASERADRLSLFATYFRNPGLINEQLDRYERVTDDAVNAFVRERLGPDNRRSLLYVPSEASGTEQPAAA